MKTFPSSPFVFVLVFCFNFVSIGYKMNKCVGAIEEFEFLPLSCGKHLHLTIAVTGWLGSDEYSKCVCSCVPIQFVFSAEQC